MNTLERLKLTNLLKKTVDERNAETNTLKRLKLANQVQQLRKQLGLIVAVEQNEPLTPQQNIEQSDEQAQLNRLTQIALKSKTRQELNEQFGLSEKALDYFQSGYDFFIENFNDGTYYYIDGENWQEVVKTEKQRLANAGIAIPTIQELLGDVDYLTKEYWQERLVSTVSFIKKVRDNISSNRKAYLHLSELGREMAKQELALKNPELSFVAMVNYGSELRKIKTDNQNSNTVATEQESQSNNTFNTKIIKGRKNSVKTAKGTKIDTVFALVDGKYVIAGHTETGAENPKYDQSLQPRDRSRESSIAWVSKTANNLDPESLGRTGRADTGAPIIGDDMMVESGNGRTMAIKLAYKNGNAEEYRQWLIDEADMFGFTEAQVSQFKEPILVRIRTSEIDRATFAIEANQDDKLSLSATERAKADAKRLDDNLMALFNPSDDGDLMASSNMPFIRGFLAKLGDTEASQYSDSNGKPTQALIARIKASIFAKAYDDDRLLEMMADVANPELQNMLNALSKSAPKFIEARVTAKGDTQDLSEKLVDGIELALDQKLKNAIIDASNLILQAKQNNQVLAEYVKQQGLFGDVEPEVVDLALFMAKNARSAKKMTEYFSAMAEYVAQDNLNRENLGLFGEPEPLKLSDVMAFANRKLGIDVENGDLLIQDNNSVENTPMQTTQNPNYSQDDTVFNQDDMDKKAEHNIQLVQSNVQKYLPYNATGKTYKHLCQDILDLEGNIEALKDGVDYPRDFLQNILPEYQTEISTKWDNLINQLHEALKAVNAHRQKQPEYKMMNEIYKTQLKLKRGMKLEQVNNEIAFINILLSDPKSYLLDKRLKGIENMQKALEVRKDFQQKHGVISNTSANFNQNYTQSDIDYLQSIIDKAIDLETVDMDKMIEIGEKDEHDPMYEQALQIVSDYLDEMSK